MKNPIIPISQQFIKTSDEQYLDLKAICCFAATGFFLDNDTFYTNQKVLRPASVYENGKERKYFKWHYSPRDISFEQAVDEFTNLFETITAEQIGSRKAILPLSGGLDSRSQAAALKGNPDVFTYSYKFHNSFNETKYGKEIAERMKWQFKEYVIPIGYLWNKIDELANINQCYTEFTNPRQMAIADEFPSMGDVFYLGHWGDVLFDGMGLKDDASFDEQIQALFKKGIVKKGGMELAEDLWKYWNIEGDFKEYLLERLKSLLSEIDIDNANARIRAFKSLHWAPRWTSVNISVFAKAHPVALPYYDDRMCEFICTIPEKYLSDRKIQIEYIKRKAPELAAIPWQNFDPCNLYNYTQYGRLRYQIPVLANKVLRKGKEIISNSPCTSRNWEIQYLGKENDASLRKNIFGSKGIAPKELCEKYYSLFRNGDEKHKVWYSHPLSMLLTLAKKCE